MSWQNPQEDEFALLNMGLPSPYQELAFPNHRKRAAPFLSLDEFSPRARARWRETFVSFLKSVTLYRMKHAKGPTPRLVLKSPPHTARLAALSEIFPDAKFIHIVRNPAEVFPSSVRTWSSLFDVQGCQTPRVEALSNGAPSIEDYVLSTFNELYRDFPQARAAIPPERFCELRYEDLVADPFAQLQRIYDQPAAWPFRRRATAFCRASCGRAQLSSKPAAGDARSAHRSASALGALLRNLRVLDAREPGHGVCWQCRSVHRGGALPPLRADRVIGRSEPRRLPCGLCRDRSGDGLSPLAAARLVPYAFAVLTFQQIYSHGTEALLAWRATSAIDYVSLFIMVFMPCLLMLVVYDALLRKSRTS